MPWGTSVNSEDVTKSLTPPPSPPSPSPRAVPPPLPRQALPYHTWQPPRQNSALLKALGVASMIVGSISVLASSGSAFVWGRWALRSTPPRPTISVPLPPPPGGLSPYGGATPRNGGLAP